MNKSIVFAVALCLLATVVFSDEMITIKNLRPVNDAIINECPSFSWSKRYKTSEYHLTVTMIGETKPRLEKTIVGTTAYEVKPSDLGDFLPKGKYKWKVTTTDGDTSAEQTFTVPVLSCIPPQGSNKIDNTLNGFIDESTRTSGDLITPWRKDDFEPLVVNDEPVRFFPAEGEKTFAMKIHETYFEDPSKYQGNETQHGIGKVVVTPDIGDNLFAFRYVYYTTGNSTIHVELIDVVGTVTYLGCIGVKHSDDGHPDVPCELDTTDGVNHFSPGINVQQGKDPQWNVFKRLLPPRNDTKSITLRLRYERALREKDDGVSYNYSNYLFFASEFTYGQCTGIRDDYYDPTNTSGDLGSLCFYCPSAGYSIPLDYVEHCMTCSGSNPVTECESSSYCTPCTINDVGVCQESSISTCRSYTNCSTRGTTKRECANLQNCAWCDIDQKCVFYTDRNVEGIGCSTCGTFKNKDDCTQHKSSCSWCSTLQLCTVKGDSCPDCSMIKTEEECTFEDTDGICQYCYAQNKCLDTSTVCDESCKGRAQSECNTGPDSDCKWCVSTNNCTEKRIECKDCSSVGSSSCQPAYYPGCTLCDTMYCTSDPSNCPVCDTRNKDNCEYEGTVQLNCVYCNSSRKCTAKSEECVDCGTIVNASTCKSYTGCSFCTSEQVCKSADDLLTDCDCSGLSASVCNQHKQGCCWSENNHKCYDLGDDNCKGGLETTTIIIIGVTVGVVVAAAAIIIPILVCCCKPKNKDDIEMTAPGTIVVLPEGQPSMVVAQESLASVNVDPATAVSVDETGGNMAAAPSGTSMQDMQNMQNMIAQQQMLNTMMAAQQQQMSMNMMMNNPMMMGSMNMMPMSGMAGMSGMNSMGMDMNSLGMTGGMNSLTMSNGMANGMQPQSGMQSGMQGGM